MNDILRSAKPVLLEGGVGIDDRGQVSFVNGFAFEGVKRFYLVANHRQGFIRAWHGHRRESKYVVVVQGAALVGCVQVHDWDHPDPAEEVHRHVLSAVKPAVLFIPAGYANGFMSLTDDAKVMFFSTSTMEESRNDDIRLDARFWDPWQIVER